MSRDASLEALVRVVAALMLALIVSPVIRTATIELNNSVGRAWPFSLTYCHARASPGCDAAEGGAVGMTARVQASR